jgi:hypothetical protein
MYTNIRTLYTLITGYLQMQPIQIVRDAGWVKRERNPPLVYAIIRSSFNGIRLQMVPRHYITDCGGTS